MNMLRNREVRITLLLYSVLCLLAVGIAFSWEKQFGLFTLLLSFIFIIIYYVSTYFRYKKITQLSADIDRILHGIDSKILLDQYSEGELGILQSEINKMTVRLRQQRQQLQDDKIYLADSIADISHQIRTPLTSINLLVQFLSEPQLTEQRRSQLIRELSELLQRIDWLITTLLKISKLDAGTVSFKAEKMSLSQLIQTASAPLLIPMELREQTLEVKAYGSFYGDMAWSSEALGNIIKNCMEHTPHGGSIRITAEDNALFSQITVCDNGTGIDPEDLPHIFERFYKGKNSGDKSFGIGLALARSIIAKQNGTVKAENNPSGGALFTIRFYKGTI